MNQSIKGNLEEFEIIRSGEEITKLTAEKEIQLMKEREKVELCLTEIDTLMSEKVEQEKVFNLTKKKMMKSLAECQEIINQLMKEGAQKNKDEKEIKEQLRQSRDDNAQKECSMVSLRNNLNETEGKLKASQNKVLEKESQIMKLKIELSIYRDLSCKREKGLKKEISELQKEKVQIQSWSEELQMENEALRNTKEIAQIELKRVIAVLQKRALSESVEKSQRLALPPSETYENSKEQRDLRLCSNQDNLQEENMKLQTLNNELKQQLCEAQYELNNVDIQSYLIMLENQVDQQCSENQSLERKEILKKSVYLTLTGIRQLCDHQNIDMEFTI